MQRGDVVPFIHLQEKVSSLQHIDREQRVKRGDVVPFIHLQEKVSSLQTHRQGTEGEERRCGSLHSSTREGKQPSNT